jgi:hypothetical protein
MKAFGFSFMGKIGKWVIESKDGGRALANRGFRGFPKII